MITLLNFADALQFLPVFLIPAAFMAIVVVVIVVAVKKSQEEKSRRESNDKKNNYVDGNGRTQSQRDYINGLRTRQAERKARENDKRRDVQGDGHSHSGKAELYEPIVGSLGEVNDEGCDELDGVRLLEHDEAYCDDPEHFAKTDTDDLKQAIVLGEVLNNPRFVNPYKKK